MPTVPPPPPATATGRAADHAAANPSDTDRFARIAETMQEAPEPLRKPRRKASLQAPPADAEAPASALVRALALVRSGQVDAGLTLCHRIWPLVQAKRDTQHMGVCQHVMTVGYYYSGMLKEALASGYRGLELLQQAGDQDRLLRLMSLHAVTLSQIGQGGEALQLLQRAIDQLPHASQAPEFLCSFWNNAGGAYGRLDHDDEALAAWERCCELAAAPGFDDPPLKAVATGNLLSCRLSQLTKRQAGRDETHEAYDAVRRHIDDVIEQGRPHLVLNLAIVAADALTALGELEETRAVLRLGHKTALVAGLGPKRAQIELRFARAARLSNQYRLAGAHVAEALNLLAKGPDLSLLAEVHLENSALQRAQQHWRSALDAFTLHAQAREAWLTAQANSRAEALAVRVELERSRAEAELGRMRTAAAPNAPALGAAAVASSAPPVHHRDPLTGLLNRAGFEQQLVQLQDASPAGQPLVLLVGRVDHFTQTNGRLGHAKAEALLRHVGQCLREHLRVVDAVARWGGEEFVVAFGGQLPLARAQEVAARLRTGIEQRDWALLAPGLRVSFCPGLHDMAPGEDWAEALLLANRAAHQATGAEGTPG